MNHRRLAYTFLIVLFITVVVSSAFFLLDDQSLKVTFFDVGQGDAILIQKGNQEILIDGGRNGKMMLEKLGRTLPFWDRKIETVIVTHPDADHMGGLIDVIRNYEIGAIIQTDSQSESKAFISFQAEIESKNIPVLKGRAGMTIKMTEEIVGKIIHPQVVSESASSTNENSIVIDLDFLDENFLLTGDLPGELEGGQAFSNLRASVLKVSHHGSKFSTTNQFLEQVQPKIAIISVGKNSYGHPNQETISRLQSHGADILRTDEKGDVMFSCTKRSESDADCVLSIQKQ